MTRRVNICSDQPCEYRLSLKKRMPKIPYDLEEQRVREESRICVTGSRSLGRLRLFLSLTQVPLNKLIPVVGINKIQGRLGPFTAGEHISAATEGERETGMSRFAS